MFVDFKTDAFVAWMQSFLCGMSLYTLLRCDSNAFHDYANLMLLLNTTGTFVVHGGSLQICS
jgi:hypothetical protein